MKILLIGGTLFLGRHLVDAALSAGHEVTLFNRGRTNAGLYPELETVHGDRTRELHLLEGRRWDAVIDTCGYLPDVVRASAERFRGSAGHYTFISSASVYADPLPPGAREDAPLQTMDEAQAREFRPEHYGALKALCERALVETLPEGALVVRSGLLAGPYDPTGRLPYWIGRIAEGGVVLAPGSRERQVQLIHARDMADWIVRMAEARRVGTFNVTGPGTALTMGDLLDCAAEVTRGAARFAWVPEPFLLAQGVVPWTELPFWVPEDQNGILSLGIERALRAGLVLRPLAETLADTLSWMPEAGGGPGTLASGVKLGTTLTREREAALLRAWARER